MEFYITDEIYHRLVAALVGIEPNPFHDPASQVMEVLGEVAGVWPASLQPDPVMAALDAA